MNPSLLLGIIIGLITALFLVWAIVATGGRKNAKAAKSFNERSLAELIERNAIGHDQLAALWKIAGYLAPKDTRAADRKARRERIAVRMMAGFATSCDGSGTIEAHAEYAIRWTDALIAELDKPSE
jgi:hypothetical protein